MFYSQINVNKIPIRFYQRGENTSKMLHLLWKDLKEFRREIEEV
jgi:hypothetical protein